MSHETSCKNPNPEVGKKLRHFVFLQAWKEKRKFLVLEFQRRNALPQLRKSIEFFNRFKQGRILHKYLNITRVSTFKKKKNHYSSRIFISLKDKGPCGGGKQIICGNYVAESYFDIVQAVVYGSNWGRCKIHQYMRLGEFSITSLRDHPFQTDKT